jgi:hypothetical protein
MRTMKSRKNVATVAETRRSGRVGGQEQAMKGITAWNRGGRGLYDMQC